MLTPTKNFLKSYMFFTNFHLFSSDYSHKLVCIDKLASIFTLTHIIFKRFFYWECKRKKKILQTYSQSVLEISVSRGHKQNCWKSCSEYFWVETQNSGVLSILLPIVKLM